MQLRYLLCALGLLTTGCTTYDPAADAQANAAADTNYCQSLGAKTDDQMFQCRMQVQQQRANAQSQAQEERQAAAARLGAVINQQNASRYPPQLHCTSVQNGVLTNTNCY